MARYEAIVLAKDSYIIQQSGIIPPTGTQLNIQGKSTVQFPTGNIRNSAYNIISDESDMCYIEFPHSPAYSKKRLVSSASTIFVRSHNLTLGGPFTTSAPERYLKGAIATGAFGGKNPFFRGTFQRNEVRNRSGVLFDDIGTNASLDYAGSTGNFARFFTIAFNIWTDPSFGYPVRITPNGGISFQSTFVIDSHRGQRPPQALQIYEDVAITVTNLTPATGFINEKETNRFSWLMSYSQFGVGEELRQQSATFQWRIAGSSQINTRTVTGANQFIDIPAFTFPKGLIEWRVQITSNDNIASPFSNWHQLSNFDGIPEKPAGLFPGGGVRDGMKPILFSWLYRNPMSTPQSAFEIQITYNNGQSWINLAPKRTTSSTEFTAAPNTIIPTNSANSVGWRVRVYNTDDVASEWSNIVYFVVYPAPQTPVWRSVEIGKTRPLCTWTSIGQVAFQIQITGREPPIIFDSGEVYGEVKQYRIPEYIANGNYLFRVRIKNMRGMWSNWTDYEATILTPKRIAVELTGKAAKNAALLNWTVDITE